MDIQQIIEKYKKGATLTQLAYENNCSIDKIRWHLQQHKAWVPAKFHKISLPEDEIIDLYKQDFSVEDIAKKFNISTTPVIRILVKNKVRKPNKFKVLPYSVYEKVINKDYFLTVVREQVTKKNVCKFLNLNYDMVASLYKYHNIENISSSQARSLLKQKQAPLILTKENFIQKYYQEHLSLEKIAEEMNVSINYLRKIVKEEWTLPLRSRGETRLSKEFIEVRNNKQTLETDIKNISIKDMCEKYKVSWEVMREAISNLNIDVPQRYRSSGEKSIENFVSSLFSEQKEIITCAKKIIYPYELDIYIPDHKLAIEYCGLYWHSEQAGKDKHYHLNKLKLCQEKGIRLLTIFEDEYIKTPYLVENRIKHALGIFDGKKINARQCVVREISPREKQDFLTKFHLQGNDISSVFLGLFFEDQLVAVMTFSKPSRSRNSKRALVQEGLWELNRYATNYEYSVRGGAGKLLKYFMQHYAWNEIYSYADRRWSEGEMYKKLGFKLTSISKPNYWYVPKGYYKREYRYNYTKYKLIEAGHDKYKTETQIMQEKGYTRIWDCGMLKFVLKA